MDGSCSVLAQDLFQSGSELHSQLVHKVVAAVVGLLYIAALHDTHVELVDVGSQGLVDSFLQLGDVLLASEFADDRQAGVLDVEDGVINALDVVLGDFHPGESAVAAVLCG